MLTGSAETVCRPIAAFVTSPAAMPCGSPALSSALAQAEHSRSATDLCGRLDLGWFADEIAARCSSVVK
jgi:hypothetical protein